jgi:hypothetical protein
MASGPTWRHRRAGDGDLTVVPWRAAVVVVAPLALFATLYGLSSSWYSVDLSGIPDEGPVPPQILTWFLYHYQSGGRVWSDSTRLLVFATACLALIAPAAAAFFVARDRFTVALALLVVAAIVSWVCFSIPAPRPGAAGYFSRDSIHDARQWVVALAVVGALIGRAGRSRST